MNQELSVQESTEAKLDKAARDVFGSMEVGTLKVLYQTYFVGFECADGRIVRVIRE